MKPVYRTGWLMFRLVFKTYFRWRTFNPERVPLHGPVLLTGNHESYIDPPLIGAAVQRELYYLARESAFRFPPFGGLLRRVNAVPLDPHGGGVSGLKTGLDILKEDRGLILFPEGTRSKDGQMQPFRSGIGLLVVKSSAPVVPVRVFGTHRAYGRHLKIPRPRPVSVKFGQPLHFFAERREAQSCSKARLKELYRQIADQIRDSILQLEPVPDPTEFTPARPVAED